MPECRGQSLLISISLTAHCNIKYSISENVAHFILLLFTMPVLLPGLTNRPSKRFHSHMQSLLSGNLYDKLSEFRQISWYFSSVLLTTTISALWSAYVTRDNQVPGLPAYCRSINFHGELEMQIICFDSLCKSLLCSHLYRALGKQKEEKEWETRERRKKGKDGGNEGKKIGFIFCFAWYPAEETINFFEFCVL